MRAQSSLREETALLLMVRMMSILVPASNKGHQVAMEMGIWRRVWLNRRGVLTRVLVKGVNC